MSDHKLGNDTIIMGDDCLNKYKLHVDNESKLASFWIGRHSISFLMYPSMQRIPKSSTKCLLAVQFKKTMYFFHFNGNTHFFSNCRRLTMKKLLAT